MGRCVRMLHRLRPADLDSLGLAAALQALCGAWTERTGIACTLQVEGVARAMGDSVDMTIYRVAQEALTNVAPARCGKQGAGHAVVSSARRR